MNMYEKGVIGLSRAEAYTGVGSVLSTTSPAHLHSYLASLEKGYQDARHLLASQLQKRREKDQ